MSSYFYLSPLFTSISISSSPNLSLSAFSCTTRVHTCTKTPICGSAFVCCFGTAGRGRRQPSHTLGSRRWPCGGRAVSLRNLTHFLGPFPLFLLLSLSSFEDVRCGGRHVSLCISFFPTLHLYLFFPHSLSRECTHMHTRIYGSVRALAASVDEFHAIRWGA